MQVGRKKIRCCGNNLSGCTGLQFFEHCGSFWNLQLLINFSGMDDLGYILFCLCCLQKHSFMFAHVSHALDIMTHFPFCFCSVTYCMICVPCFQGVRQCGKLEESAVPKHCARPGFLAIHCSAFSRHDCCVLGSCLRTSPVGELWLPGWERDIAFSLRTRTAVLMSAPMNLLPILGGVKVMRHPTCAYGVPRVSHFSRHLPL